MAIAASPTLAQKTAVDINLKSYSQKGSFAEGDQLLGIHTVTGSAFADRISGSTVADTLQGGAGNDFLWGKEGDDTLTGGDGNDVISGDQGNDIMKGGKGDDSYFVDTQGDSIVENANEGIDNVSSTVSLALSENVENLTLTGLSNINGTGNGLNNKIDGNDGINSIWGGAGNDTLTAKAGDDYIDGGDGADHIRGGAGKDTVFGGIGNDIVNGDEGDDRLDAGSGDDTIMGGQGKDVLIGGAGRDNFTFYSAAETSVSAADVINDFQKGYDRIDLRGMDASTKKSGDQGFAYIGESAFSGTAGQLHSKVITEQNGHFYTWIEGDINGDRVADFGIALDNYNGKISATDFYL